MATNEREIVLDSLIQICEKDRFSHLVEKAVLDKYDYLDSARKAFIKRCIDGTIENGLIIDEIINNYSKVKIDKQRPLIRQLLRMSVYQIVFLDKVPDRAVCDEAVKIASKRGFRNLTGFVNGILRNISRDKDKLNIDMEKAIPEWIREHLISSYGKDVAMGIIKSMNEAKPVTIRARRNLSDTSMLNKSKLLPNAYVVNKGVSIKDIPGYENGDFVVQDLSSMMAVENAGIKKGDLVIDICASPGGKSIYAYDLGGNVISRDVSDYKVEVIQSNLDRLGINEGIKLQVFDARDFDQEYEEKADVLIADVPCSGLGVMGKKSDIRFKLKKEDMDNLISLQKDIISSSYKYVKKNGVLMYSTCTLNPDENEKMTDYICKEFNFIKDYEKLFIPGIDETDGFYVARLIRN